MQLFSFKLPREVEEELLTSHKYRDTLRLDIKIAYHVEPGQNLHV
jgi:hypothetical protein